MINNTTYPERKVCSPWEIVGVLLFIYNFGFSGAIDLHASVSGDAELVQTSWMFIDFHDANEEDVNNTMCPVWPWAEVCLRQHCWLAQPGGVPANSRRPLGGAVRIPSFICMITTVARSRLVFARLVMLPHSTIEDEIWLLENTLCTPDQYTIG